MPTPTISTKIAMDGEKEYKAALAEINSGLKVLSSEMKLTATQFAENADSMEALTATGDVLERQILSQKEKIETLKAALQNSAEAFGESDAKTQKWQVSLNNAEAELVKMERELRDNQAAIQEATEAAQNAENAYSDMADALGESTEAADESRSILDKLRGMFGDTEGKAKSLGEMAEDLAGKLGINLPEGAKEALDALGDVNAETAILAGGAAAAAAAVIEIEKALINLTTERAAVAANIANISETINMSVEATQEWDYVLKTVGSSIEDAQGDLSAFQEKIMEANTGTGEAAEMFAKLGVNVTDQSGRLRDTEAVLLDTINALQLMADETDRNATSSILLGGTGEKLIPIYNQSAESLQYLLDKKSELGIMTGDEIEALKDVAEALLDYEERTNSAKDTIAAEFAPALEEFYEKAGMWLKDTGDAAEESGLVNFFGTILELITALLPALDLLNSLVTILEPAFDGLSVSLGLLADGLAIVVNLVTALGNLIALDFDGAGQNWDNIMSIFSGGSNSATARAWNNAYNASGDQNFGGGFTWVGENGPELAYFPQGTRIYNNQESRAMGGDTFNFNIEARNIKEFNDLVKMAQEERRRRRMEGDE